jgi:hypothetical protein
MHDLRDVGGTKGGLVHFLVGLVMAVIGGYLFLNQVTVHGGYWNFGFGGSGTSFGITLIPLLFGVAMLFYSGKSIIGWFLTVAGGLVIFAGVIANLSIHFRGTSLFATLIMLALLAGGLGLIFRSLRSVG